ncbi:hypothetical protein DFH07DRAFT_814455 [Mycena maculata]|uniref:DNA2/NAM7 helicase helicase domain-containing protein n=1 Tax=Mycena maculata TaxID=230809 RepID=A0AAD7JFW9_9AGAR|nr:hypothetical protein DFH07DRAFT_814455 [Mycena maculata]
MSEAPFTFVQDVFKAPHPPIEVTTRQYSGLSRKVLQAFLKTADDGVVGVAPAYGSKCVLSVVAFASSTTILVVRFPKNLKNGKRPGPSTAGKDLQDLILCADSHSKVAFQMDVLATSLYHDLDLRISGAVDLLSVAEDHRHSLGAIMNSIGGVVNLNRPKVIGLFKGEEQWNKISVHDVALQAWVAWRAGTLEKMGPRLKKLPRIDTGAFSEARLSAFSKMVRDACRLSAAKPTRIKNEIASDFTIKKDRLHLTCTRFKTRVRREQSLEIQRGRQTTVSGRSTQVKGRAAQIQLSSALPAGPITVTTVGKEPPTFAEVRRTEIILTALQRRSSIAEQPFFQAIWSPLETPRWPTGPSVSRSAPINFQRPLNDSQVRGVEAILSTEPIVVIHGPPGTGKTTVIAAAVRNISQNRTMFLSAQSNVAVKNIAEKLASVDFLDFKILVSEEFHYDWHEHLYEKINPNLIRSDQFVDDIVATERQLLGSKVILCTLSMLSSPGISTIIRLVPPQTIIVDEASQVEIGNYLSVISRFSKSLRKLVFIGDDKQLAPYGQNDIDNLQSVFEIAHLREGAIFLDTQYRLVSIL